MPPELLLFALGIGLGFWLGWLQNTKNREISRYMRQIEHRALFGPVDGVLPDGWRWRKTPWALNLEARTDGVWTVRWSYVTSPDKEQDVGQS